MNSRIQEIGIFLQEKQISAGFITSTSNLFYITGYYCVPHERLVGIFILQDEQPVLVCPNMEVEVVKSTGWKHSLISYSDTEDPWQLVKNYFEGKNIVMTNIAIEDDHMTVNRLNELTEIYPNLEINSLEEKMRDMRVVKTTSEIDLLRNAAELADFAVEVGVSSLKEGISEIEVMAKIEFELKKKGIRKMSFDPVVLFGANAANPHGASGNQTLKRGDFVLFDLGVIVEGYCSDITRTVIFGEPNEEQKNVYNTVLQAQEAAISVCRPGESMANVDFAARKVITDAGYGKYFNHRIGHGLGIGIHEYPSLHAENQEPLIEKMVITIEPGIYIHGKVGIRIEDDLLITENGFELLTKYPKNLQIIK